MIRCGAVQSVLIQTKIPRISADAVKLKRIPDHHEIRGEYEEDATLLTGQVMIGMQAIIQTSHMQQEVEAMMMT